MIRAYLLAGALVILAGTHIYAYRSGNTNGTNAVLVGTLQASNEALTKRASENEAIAKEYASHATKASIDHANEIQAIRAAARRDAGKRVPVSPGFCAATGKTEAAEAGSDGQADAGAAFLPDAFASDLRQLAADADEVAADLRTLKARARGCFQ